MTYANEIFSVFLAKQVEDILLNMAAASLTNTIDYSVPVLGVISKRRSLLHVDFYFAVMDPKNAVTTYQVSSLPTVVSDGNYKSLDVPTKFSLTPNNNGYVFPSGSATNLLTSCVDSFIGSEAGNMQTNCGITNFSTQRLVKIFVINRFNVFYARGITAIVKIACPGEKFIVFSLTADILVFIAPVKCHVDMVTTAGIISYQANATYLDPMVYTTPQMVFRYSLDKDVGEKTMKTIILIILCVLVFLFLVMTFETIYYMYISRITAQFIETHSSHTLSPMSELEEHL